MPKVYNITNRLSNEKPVIVMGEKQYFVNNSMSTLFKFEELSQQGTKDGMHAAIKLALGDKAAKEIKIDDMSVDNFKVLSTTIIAAMQGVEYEEAEARFQKATGV